MGKKINIEELTLGQLKEIIAMADEYKFLVDKKETMHPFVGKRCLVRTYSAGVHIGEVTYINEMEVHLKNALRLWKWSDGGLSLSAIANNG